MKKGLSLAVLFLAGCFLSPSLSAQSQDVTYTYDELGRLKTVTYSTGETIQYTYDPAGNRLAQAISGTAGGTSTAGLNVVVLPISGFVVLPIRDPDCSLISGCPE